MLLGVSGVRIYLLAKVVKQVVNRGRPNAFLEVAEREHFAEGSIGYTSGHVAVAATIATLTVAHLPLDMVGGAAMGIAAGTFAMLVDRLLTRGTTTQEEPTVEAGS